MGLCGLSKEEQWLVDSDHGGQATAGLVHAKDCGIYLESAQTLLAGFQQESDVPC